MKRISRTDRAQAIQIGALFIFVFLIIGISVAQLFVVPDQNGQVEFNHNREVQDQMIDLRKDLLRTVSTGQSRAATVTLGTTYPSRGVLLNPGPPGGTLRTEPMGSYYLDNALATDGEAADYWRGTNRSFVTKRIVYQPGYNYYTNAPRTVFESTVLYNRFPSRNVTVEDQTLVSGRTINLVLINGSLSASSTGSTTVEPTAIGGEAQTVQVAAESSSDPIELTVPTSRSEAAWRSLLSSELETGSEDPDKYIESLDCSNGATDSDPSAPCRNLKLTFETGTEYSLVIGEAGVGTRINRSHADPKYIVTTDGDGASLPEGTSRQLTVEVRDRFDNPVSGATVRFNVTGTRAGFVRNDTTVGPDADGLVNVTTDVQGRATITYHAPLNVGGAVEPNVSSWVPAVDDPDEEGLDNATFELTVQDDDDSVSNDDWSQPLVTAVEPKPQTDSNNIEFVELYAPRGADLTDYRLVDNRTGTPVTIIDFSTAAEVDSDTSGIVFINESGSFSPPRSPAATVQYAGGYSELKDSYGIVELKNQTSGNVVDEVAYGDGTVETSDGWAVDLQSNQLLNRSSDEDSAYVDTNTSNDWSTENEGDYFGSSSGGGKEGKDKCPPKARVCR